MKKMLWTCVAALAFCGTASAALPRFAYPGKLEGSVLTADASPAAQYIIGIVPAPKNTSATYEIARLDVLAQVRDAMRVRFNLQSRPGHTAWPGFRLNCFARTRVGSVLVYLSAWSLPEGRVASMRQFAAFLNPSRWQGGCT